MKMKNKFTFFISIIIFFLGGISCKQEYTPKPLGYHRIEFPEKTYTQYANDCPFVFEYPEYGKIVKDTTQTKYPCWFNIKFPEYDGTIHLSYRKIDNNLNKYIEDSRTFAYKHTVKAEAIGEQFYRKPEHNVYGLMYSIKGNVASNVQFFLTDSNNHFIRGALYFMTEPNKDSLAPVIEFLKKDIVHLIETFKWKNK